MKTNKSVMKRLRVTKNGKVIARKAGFNHFNAKQKRSKQLSGRKPFALSLTNKDKRRFLSNA